MNRKYEDLVDNLMLPAIFSSPIILVGACAAINGIQHNQATPEMPAITLIDKHHRLKCLSESVLKVTTINGEFDFNVNNCNEE